MIGRLSKATMVPLLAVGVATIAADAADTSASETSISAPTRDCAECPEIIEIRPAASTGLPPYFIGKFEVTWHEYLQAVAAAGCPMPQAGGDLPMKIRDISTVDDNVAVSGVHVADVECYLTWLSKVTGKKYRLPVPAEWEFAARGGATTRYPWGDDIGFNNAFVGRHFEIGRYPSKSMSGPRAPSNVREVGLLEPNAYGLYDVIGNVSEMTAAFRHETGLQNCGPTPTCRLITVRGGDYFTGTDYDLELQRFMHDTITMSSVGFRVSRSK